MKPLTFTTSTINDFVVFRAVDVRQEDSVRRVDVVDRLLDWGVPRGSSSDGNLEEVSLRGFFRVVEGVGSSIRTDPDVIPDRLAAKELEFGGDLVSTGKTLVLGEE